MGFSAVNFAAILHRNIFVQFFTDGLPGHSAVGVRYVYSAELKSTENITGTEPYVPNPFEMFCDI